MRGGFMRRLHRDTEEDFSLRELSGRAMQLLRSYLTPYWKRLLLATLAMLLVTASTLAGPILIKLAVDRFIRQGNIDGLNLFLAAYIAVYLVFWFSSFWQRYLTNWVGQSVILDIRRDIARSVFERPMRFFDRHSTGDLVARIVHDVESLSDLLSSGIVYLVNDVLTLGGILVIMLTMNTRLTLIVLVTAPVVYLIMRLLGQAIRRASRRVREAVADLNVGVHENISGIRVIQSLSKEEQSALQFNQLNRAAMQANLGAASVTALLFPAMSITGSLGTALVLWAGGHGIAAGTVSIGTFMAFLAYISRFFAPLRELSLVYGTYQTAGAALERIGDYLEYSYEETGLPEKTIAEGSAEFVAVTFGYEPEEPVLVDFELTIEAGDTVALVGKTGAGKTTVTNLLTRLYRPNQGEIRVGGTPLRDYTNEELRRAMAVVPQDTYLFPGSIAENIAYARPDASADEIRNAARAVGAHSFIEKLPKGYQTQVGERGDLLSGGQKQLLALARAMLADPVILILDEATSSVDAVTEAAIQEAMDTILAGRTAIIIAHRFSTVREADRVCVMEEGELVAVGSHNELWKESEQYRELCSAQWLAMEE